MLNRLKSFIKQHQLFENRKRVLLAVSGGVDSMVMLHLFSQLEVEIAVAHVNFSLRGNESDEDQKWVELWAKNLGVDFFTQTVDTKAYAKKHKLSTQLAARKIRYDWFFELLQKHNLDVLATAHHATDQTETVLINLLRGTGIEGLKGIPMNQPKIIRPLLGFSRDEIEYYSIDNKIAYREDQSNLSDKYVRNKIRHHVLPVFEDINPSYHKNIIQTTEILGGIAQVLQSEVDKLEKLCLKAHSSTYFVLNCTYLVGYPHYDVLLYYLLNKFGVNRYVYQDILKALDKEAGLTFETTEYLITKDRDTFIIEKLDEDNKGFEFELSGIGTFDTEIGTFKVEKIPKENVRMTDSKTVALLDDKRCDFPLIVKNKKTGDSFTPLGMQGAKLLSDFFIDEKVPLPQKNRIPIVWSNNQIIWVAGMRISHLHKIGAATDYVLRIIWQPIE